MKLKIVDLKTDKIHQEILPFEKEGDEYFIGKHIDCGVNLNKSEVSRVHARIKWKNAKFFFNDLGSTNGSKINNQEIDPLKDYPIEQGYTIRIGDFFLLVEDVALDNLKPPNLQDKYPTLQPQHWGGGEIIARCVEIIDETYDVKTFRFVTSPPMVFNYLPGQFVTLKLEIDGKQVMRSYSISSSPSRPHSLDITVKRVPPPMDVPDAPPGLVSNWLHDHLQVGTEVKLSSPMGKFTCFPNPQQKLLFISAGSGITPMMSMSRYLCDTVSDTDIIFIHSARSEQDIIFRQELELMACRHPQFKLAINITRSELRKAWLGYIKRLNESMLQAIAPDFLQRTVYVCGPNPFMQSVKSMLQGLNFPMEQYYEESFGSPKKVKTPSKPKDQAPFSNSNNFNVVTKLQKVDDPEQEVQKRNHVTPELIAEGGGETAIASQPTLLFTSNQYLVVFAKSGNEVETDGKESILDIAEMEGIDILSGCRMGVCGACKLKKLEGEVKYDKTPGFKCNSGEVLACVAKPQGRVVIDA